MRGWGIARALLPCCAENCLPLVWVLHSRKFVPCSPPLRASCNAVCPAVHAALLQEKSRLFHPRCARCTLQLAQPTRSLHAVLTPLSAVHAAPLQEKSRLFRAIDTVPAVGKKAEWAIKWISGWAGRIYCCAVGGSSAQAVRACSEKNVLWWIGAGGGEEGRVGHR